MPKISEPQLKGLQATARGEVIRTYTGSVYTITGPVGSKALWSRMPAATLGIPPVSRSAAHRLTGGLFVDANDLPVSLAAKLDFAGPSVETLDAYRR